MKNFRDLPDVSNWIFYISKGVFFSLLRLRLLVEEFSFLLDDIWWCDETSERMMWGNDKQPDVVCDIFSLFFFIFFIPLSFPLLLNGEFFICVVSSLWFENCAMVNWKEFLKVKQGLWDFNWVKLLKYKKVRMSILKMWESQTKKCENLSLQNVIITVLKIWECQS